MKLERPRQIKTPRSILSNVEKSGSPLTPNLPEASPADSLNRTRERLSNLENSSGELLGEIWRMNAMKSRHETLIERRNSPFYLGGLICMLGIFVLAFVSWGNPMGYGYESIKYIIDSITFGAKIDPRERYVFANLVLLPTIGVCFHWHDRRARPFCIAAFAVGCFSYLPFMIIYRKPHRTAKSRGIERSPLAAFFLLLAASIVFAYGTVYGESFGTYRKRFLTHPFVNLMTIDFLWFSILSAEWILTDLAADAAPEIWTFAALFPVIGPAAYLLLNSRDSISKWPESPRSKRE